MALPAGLEVRVGRNGNPYNFYARNINTDIQHFQYMGDSEVGDSVYVLRNGPPPANNLKFRDRRRAPAAARAPAAVGRNIGMDVSPAYLRMPVGAMDISPASFRMPVGPMYISPAVPAAPVPAQRAVAAPVPAAHVPAPRAVAAPVPAPAVAAQINIRAAEAPYARQAAVSYNRFQIDGTAGYRAFLASIGAGAARGGRRKTHRRAR